jgi:ribose transport system substrate-binding protein
VGVVVGLAACGSSSKSSSTSAAAGTTAASTASAPNCGTPAAQAAVAPYLTRPTSINISTPIKGGIKPGKHLVWIQGPFPDAHAFGDNLQKIAAKIGWTVTKIDATGTPESVKAAWDEALRVHPDAISQGGGGWPMPPYAAELAQAEKEGIIVVGFAETHSGAPWKFSIGTGDGFGTTGFGDLSALFAATKIHNGDKVLSLNLPGIGLVRAQVTEFENKLKQLCPATHVDEFDVPLSSLGKDAPTRIASFIQGHPGYKYMYLTTIDLAIGLDAAYKAAGVTPPPTNAITSTTAGLQTLQNHQAGLLMTVHGSSASFEGSYRFVDGLARIYAGQSTAPDTDASIPKWIVLPNTVPSGEGAPIPAVKDGAAQFYHLWGVKGY